MQEKKQHTLFVTHSNKKYLLDLSIGVSKKGYSITKQNGSGIDALKFILQNQPEVAILEAELSLLSAVDIIEKAKKEKVKTQFIVILKTRELPMLKPLQYVKINDVYYCNMSVKALLKVLARLYKTKNTFWNLMVRKFQEVITKTINKNLNVSALKLNLTQQQTSLKEWYINNNAILKAFSLRRTTYS